MGQNNSPMHIGQVIRSLREEKGWSQEKLALEAGMVTSHVSRIERGERRLPTERLEVLAAALGTSPAAVFARLEGLPPPEGKRRQKRDNLFALLRCGPMEGGVLVVVARHAGVKEPT